MIFHNIIEKRRFVSKVVGILLKNNEVTSYGVKNWLYVTKEQFDKIMESQLNPEMRNFRWAVNDRTFTLSDIKETKVMDVEYAKTLPTWGKYIENRVKEQELLEAQNQNPEGLKKIEEMKSKFKLGGGLNEN